MNITDAISSLAMEVLSGGKVYNTSKSLGSLVPADYTTTPKDSHDTIIDNFSDDEIVVSHYRRYIKDSNIIVELFYNKEGFGAVSKVFPFKSYSVDFTGSVNEIQNM